MRLLKLLLIATLAYAVLTQVPAVSGAFRAGYAEARAQAPTQTVDLATTTERICPVYRLYLRANPATRPETADAVRTIAIVTSRQTTDPTARALLHAIPDAVRAKNTTQRRAARAFLRYGCATK